MGQLVEPGLEWENCWVFKSALFVLPLSWDSSGNFEVSRNAPLGSQLSWDSIGATLRCRKNAPWVPVELGLDWGNLVLTWMLCDVIGLVGGKLRHLKIAPLGSQLN